MGSIEQTVFQCRFCETEISTPVSFRTVHCEGCGNKNDVPMPVIRVEGVERWLEKTEEDSLAPNQNEKIAEDAGLQSKNSSTPVASVRKNENRSHPQFENKKNTTSTGDNISKSNKIEKKDYKRKNAVGYIGSFIAAFLIAFLIFIPIYNFLNDRYYTAKDDSDVNILNEKPIDESEIDSEDEETLESEGKTAGGPLLENNDPPMVINQPSEPYIIEETPINGSEANEENSNVKVDPPENDNNDDSTPALFRDFLENNPDALDLN